MQPSHTKIQTSDKYPDGSHFSLYVITPQSTSPSCITDFGETIAWCKTITIYAGIVVPSDILRICRKNNIIYSDTQFIKNVCIIEKYELESAIFAKNIVVISNILFRVNIKKLTVNFKRRGDQ